MVSETYNVTTTTTEIESTKCEKNGNKSDVQSDNSYRSCLCALLVFIAICMLILIISIIPWTGKNASQMSANKLATTVKDTETNDLLYATKKDTQTVKSGLVTQRIYTLKPITRKIYYFTRLIPPNLNEDVTTEAAITTSPKISVTSTNTKTIDVSKTTAQLFDTVTSQTTSKSELIAQRVYTLKPITRKIYYFTRLIPPNLNEDIRTEATVTASPKISVASTSTKAIDISKTTAQLFDTVTPQTTSKSELIGQRVYTLKPIRRKFFINYSTRMLPYKKNEEVTTESANNEIAITSKNSLNTETDVLKMNEKLIHMFHSSTPSDVLITEESSMKTIPNQNMFENSASTTPTPTLTTISANTSPIIQELSSSEMIQPITTEIPIPVTNPINDKIIFREEEKQNINDITTDFDRTTIKIIENDDLNDNLKSSTEILREFSDIVRGIRNVNNTQIDSTTSKSIESIENKSRIVTTEKVVTKTQHTVVENQTDLCETNYCKATASHMYQSINLNINPCDNFYEFACGNVKTSSEQLKKDHIKQIIQNKLYDLNVNNNFKSFYFSCVTHDPLVLTENLRIILNIVESRIGIFLNNSYFIEHEKEHITIFLADLLLQNSALLFDIDLETNNDGIYTFKLIPPKQFDEADICLAKCKLEFMMSMEGPQPLDLQSNYHESDCLKSCSIKTRIESLRLILHQFNITFEQTNYTAYLEQIISDYDNLLKNMFIPNMIETNYNYEAQKNFEQKTIDDLNRDFDLFDWKVLFEKLVNNVSPGTQVRVYYYKTYFRTLFKFLKHLNVRRLHNILLGHFIHNLFMEIIMPTNRMSRDDYCFEKGIKLFPKITNDLYLDWLNRTNSLTRIQNYWETMFERLKDIFKKNVENADIENIDKTTIIKKLDTIRIYFVQSSGRQWRASMGTYLENIGQYLENYLYATAYYRHQRYSIWNETFGQPSNLWFNFESVLNLEPVTNYPNHAIVIPFGMFDNDFTIDNMESLDYLSISQSGLKLARHLMDHFNTIGLNFDLRLYCDELYRTDIEECFKEKYNQQQFVMINSKNVTYNINMAYFIDETISDSAAIRLAHNLFVTSNEKSLAWIGEKFTRDQLFYISVAQEFCDPNDDDLYRFSTKLYKYGISLPPRPRIHSFLSNDLHFPFIFNCSKGTDFNPSHQCVQFPNLTVPNEMYANIDY